MIHIRCHECGRKYNWAGDAFCPHCGAFNQAEDYSFDRERIVVELEEPETPRKVLFGQKKTTRKPKNDDDFTGHGNVGKGTPVGCLQKVIIAIVIWNVFAGVIAVVFNAIAEAL